YVSFIAQPGGTDEAGTYAITVGPPPPAPSVTLNSDVSSVASGGTVKLTWSSQNADTCTASGAWSGSQPLSGSTTSGAITASSTFTLTCNGAGGSAASTASVSVDPPKSGSGGGGGTLTAPWLAVLALLALWQLIRRASPEMFAPYRLSHGNRAWA